MLQISINFHFRFLNRWLCSQSITLCLIWIVTAEQVVCSTEKDAVHRSTQYCLCGVFFCLINPACGFNLIYFLISFVKLSMRNIQEFAILMRLFIRYQFWMKEGLGKIDKCNAFRYIFPKSVVPSLGYVLTEIHNSKKFQRKLLETSLKKSSW